jgi:arsenate reductase
MQQKGSLNAALFYCRKMSYFKDGSGDFTTLKSVAMKTRDNELLIYYDRDSDLARKVLAYARTITRHINEVEIRKTPLTSTIWRQLLEQLGLQPKDLLNKAHPYYQDHVKGRDFDDEGWLNVLIRNPELVKAPIAVRGHRVLLVENPTNILVLQSASAGLSDAQGDSSQ